jgi:hypothetical protein
MAGGEKVIGRSLALKAGRRHVQLRVTLVRRRAAH